MRAMVTPEFGPPDLFEERDVEKPGPGPEEVLVKVVAAGTNPIDAKFRAAGDEIGLEAPIILGADVSGVVEEVGPGVSEFSPGDEVYYTPEVFGPGSNGGYAEYHLAPVYLVAKKPASISLKVGESVLIHGGAGGVGSLAIQIAHAAGARVLATAAPDNQETLKQLGADVAIDYRSQDFVEISLEDTAGVGVDAVFDCVGGDTIVNSIAATKPFGRLATILGTQGDLTPMYQKNQTLHGILMHRERARLDAMTLLIERGQVEPLVDEVLPLGEVGKAHERLDSGHGRGKVVLRVSDTAGKRSR